MAEFTYRTINLAPPEYERRLADALFEIMGRSIHDAEGIAAELNRVGPAPSGACAWTAAVLKAEMALRGTWSNCIGGAAGSHGIPGIAQRSSYEE